MSTNFREMTSEAKSTSDMSGSAAGKSDDAKKDTPRIKFASMRAIILHCHCSSNRLRSVRLDKGVQFVNGPLSDLKPNCTRSLEVLCARSRSTSRYIAPLTCCLVSLACA